MGTELDVNAPNPSFAELNKKVDLKYPLLVIKNLETNIVQKVLEEEIITFNKSDQLKADPSREINIYLVNPENKNLIFWKTCYISKKFKNLLDDFIIDYKIYSKPKTETIIEEYVLNNYDYIIPSIIHEEEIIDYEVYKQPKQTIISKESEDIVNDFIKLMDDLQEQAMNGNAFSQYSTPINTTPIEIDNPTSEEQEENIHLNNILQEMENTTSTEITNEKDLGNQQGEQETTISNIEFEKSGLEDHIDESTTNIVIDNKEQLNPKKEETFNIKDVNFDISEDTFSEFLNGDFNSLKFE